MLKEKEEKNTKDEVVLKKKKTAKQAMEELNIPIEFFEKEEIFKVENLVEERSEFVKNQIGVYGVSEPCAYLASGKRGSFLVKKVKLGGVTISIFEEEM